MLSWSPWRSCRPCRGSPPRPGGCGTPGLTCGACSPACLSSPGTATGRPPRPPRRPVFPCLPQRPGYSKRLRAAASLLRHCIRALAADTSVWTDDVWVVDSTPVECGRSRETARHSDLAGWAEYGYCASHSRYFRGLRLHLVCTLQGLPVAFALAGAKADEREVLAGMLTAGPDLAATRPGQTLIGDKKNFGAAFGAPPGGAGGPR